MAEQPLSASSSRLTTTATESSAATVIPPWVLAQAKALIQVPSHALLLQGPAGLNQFDLALNLAKAWLCDTPNADHLSCGQCQSCQMFHAHTHPDLQMLLSEDIAQQVKWEGVTTDAETASKRAPSKEIKTEALRRMIEFTQRTRSRSKYQVVVIYPAERMNKVSANTVLKTLEEPTGSMKFILATQNIQSLLPTIRSRCQTHAMVWPNEQDAMAFLEQQGVEEPQILLAAAGGKPEQALQLIAQGLDAARWASIPKQLAQGNADVLNGMGIAQMVDVCNKLCHDLLSKNAGAAPRFFSANSLPNSVKAQAVIAWSKELMQMVRVAEHPWNLPLYTQSLVATAQGVLNA